MFSAFFCKIRLETKLRIPLRILYSKKKVKQNRLSVVAKLLGAKKSKPFFISKTKNKIK